MTQIEQWRQADNDFATIAQGAVDAAEDGELHQMLTYVMILRRMYREKLSLALDMDPYGWAVGVFEPRRKGLWG